MALNTKNMANRKSEPVIQNSRWIIYLAILLIAQSQINETVYAAALPKIGIYFGVQKVFLEYSLITYFIGYAIGTLMWGIIADIFGHRKIVIVALLLYFLSILVCSLSSSITFLIISRLVLGVTASIGSIMSQAILRRHTNAQDRQQIFDKVNIVIAFVPLVGLVSSSMIVNYMIWQSAFFLLMVFALLILIDVIIILPPDNLHKYYKSVYIMDYHRNNKKVRTGPKNKINPQYFIQHFLDCFQQIKADSYRLKLGVIIGGVVSLLFSYFSQSALYFKANFFLSSLEYGILVVFMSLALFGGGLISRFSKKKRNKKIFYSLIQIMVASFLWLVFSICSVSMPEIFSSNVLAFYSIITCVPILISVSIIIPNTLSQMLEPYKNMAGTAASLYGFYYYLVTSLFMLLMSQIKIAILLDFPLFVFFVSVIILFVGRGVHNE